MGECGLCVPVMQCEERRAHATGSPDEADPTTWQTKTESAVDKKAKQPEIRKLENLDRRSELGRGGWLEIAEKTHRFGSGRAWPQMLACKELVSTAFRILIIQTCFFRPQPLQSGCQ
jgi:hypothetical protein